jgi:hypothetical protein
MAMAISLDIRLILSFPNLPSFLDSSMQLGQGNIIFGYSFDSFLSESSLNNGARRHFL